MHLPLVCAHFLAWYGVVSDVHCCVSAEEVERRSNEAPIFFGVCAHVYTRLQYCSICVNIVCIHVRMHDR